MAEQIEGARDAGDSTENRARKLELIDQMLAPGASAVKREVMENALTRFPVEMLELTAEAGTKLRPLDDRERYRDASPALRRLGVDVDSWPVPPAGLFVVDEKTMYVREVTVMTIGHEFGHAVDAALGQGIYRSGFDTEFRQAFASARAFVTPYAATGLDEAFAENLRAFVGGLNDPNSPWPPATPERLNALAPRMVSFLDGVMNELRARYQEREAPDVAPQVVEQPVASIAPQETAIEAVVPSEAVRASERAPEPALATTRRGAGERRDYRQEITDKMVAAIEAGTAPWQKGWDAGERLLPFNPTTEKNYRGGNVLRLMLEGRDDPRWMTYKQANEEGWQVRKGERGTTIEYWKFEKGERATKGSSVAEDAGGVDDDGTRSGEARGTRPRVFYATVFNAEQIDGIPEIGRDKPEQRWTASERAEQLIDALGVDVRYGGSRAYYSPETEPNLIHVPTREQFHDATAFYDTLLHEAAHWTGHKDRLDRDLTGRFGSESYAKEELRAEIAGSFIAAELGIPRDEDNNAAYVASWVRVLQNDKNEIFRAATAAQQITDFVFEHALERVQELSDVVQRPESAAKPDFSKLPLFEPGPNELVERREESLMQSQTMEIRGRSDDASRVFGRDGGALVSVAAEAFASAATLEAGDVVRLERDGAGDRVERVEEAMSLDVGA